MLQFLAFAVLVVGLAYLSQCLTAWADPSLGGPATASPVRWFRAWRTRPPLLIGGWNAADIVLATVLVLFAAFRYGVGTDFELYSGMYRRLDAVHWWHSLRTVPQEPGFTLLRLTLKTVFGANPTVLFGATTILTVLPILCALKRSAVSHFALAVALYMGLGTWASGLNGIRQAIALSFVLLATSLLASRRYLLAACCLAVAVSMHISSFVVIALLALTWRWRPRWTRLGAVTLGAGLLGLVALPFLGPVLGKLNPRYARYVLVGNHAGLGTLAQILFLCVLLFAIHRYVARRSGWEQRLYVWSALALPMLLIGMRAVELARLYLYFKSFLIFLLPVVLPRMLTRWWHWLLAGVLLLGYLALHVHFYDGLLPYRIWLGRVR